MQAALILDSSKCTLLTRWRKTKAKIKDPNPILIWTKNTIETKEGIWNKLK